MPAHQRDLQRGDRDQVGDGIGSAATPAQMAATARVRLLASSSCMLAHPRDADEDAAPRVRQVLEERCDQLVDAPALVARGPSRRRGTRCTRLPARPDEVRREFASRPLILVSR